MKEEKQPCYKCHRSISEGHKTFSGKLYCFSCWSKLLKWLKEKKDILKCYFCQNKVLIWTDQIGFRKIGLCLHHYKKIYETFP